MNILSIQSHVAYGHAGNASAVFPMQRLGHEVWFAIDFRGHDVFGSIVIHSSTSSNTP